MPSRYRPRCRPAEIGPRDNPNALEGLLDMTEEQVHARIRDAVNGSDVMLFMKGSPTFPQCGFSAAVVQILDYLGVEYGSQDVLQDDDLRQGIKSYSDWPTIPQLYVKGEFVGGCDIIREMFQAGELQSHLQSKGIKLTAPTS